MAIANGSFETKDTTVGAFKPDGWSVTIVSTAEEYAEFLKDPDQLTTTGQETFEDGWRLPGDQSYVPDFSGGLFVDIEPAFFDSSGADEAEDFEGEWPVVAPLFKLSAVVFATFDSVTSGEDLEDFEEDWNAPGDTLITSLPAVSFASFDSGTPESVEDFEEEWDANESESFQFSGLGIDIAASQFQEPSTTSPFETFENERFEIQVTVDPVTERVLASGHPYSDGDRVRLRNEGGRLPEPLLIDTFYYVRNATVGDFELSNTPAGAIIDITDTGNGTHFLSADPERYWTIEVTGV